jgi:hypothetical protein
LAVAAGAIVAFAVAGANWWLFLLVLAPDLCLVAFALAPRHAATIYNLAHFYMWPLILIVAGLLTPTGPLLPLGLIWAVHIGIDRALGYGLKYPGSFTSTHLGSIGGARKAATHANAG